MDPLVGFAYGLFGGFLAELLGHFKLRHAAPDAIPIWLRSPYYWIVTVFMMIAGGGLVVIYLKTKIDMQPLIAVNIGASAPLVISAFVTQTPPAKVD